MRVFVSVDNCLADFVGGVLAMYGRPRADRDRVTRWELWDHLRITESAFWESLRPEHIWSELDKTAECDEILALAERFAGGPQNVTLLTSPAPSPGCHAGKFLWILRELPRYQHRYLMGPDKAPCAPAGVLIDDNDKNVERWREAGGWAVLLPRPWNSRRDLAGRCVEALENDLRRVECLMAFHDT